MPPSYCPCPRPILKRPSQLPASSSSMPLPDDASHRLNIDRSVVLQPLVRFSETLTRTFLAHSPAIYDRSPIVVAPNKCRLPERGCPGRTYLPGDDVADAAVPEDDYERAMARRSRTRRSTASSTRVWLEHSPPPALVPDFSSSSSSSSSDESDGFPTPPLETASMRE